MLESVQSLLRSLLRVIAEILETYAGYLRASQTEIAAGAAEFGAPIALFDTRLSDSLRASRVYDVSPDGQRFVMPVGRSAPVPITAVLNWQSALGGRER